LTGEDADEAIGLLNADDYFIWRPLLYIIPCSSVAKGRVRRVTAKDRAGPGAEYIIEDLAGHEFERIRFDGI